MEFLAVNSRRPSRGTLHVACDGSQLHSQARDKCVRYLSSEYMYLDFRWFPKVAEDVWRRSNDFWMLLKTSKDFRRLRKIAHNAFGNGLDDSNATCTCSIIIFIWTITVRLLLLGSLKQNWQIRLQGMNNKFQLKSFEPISSRWKTDWFTNDFNWNSWSASCNLIGQFCLSDPW